MVAIGGLMPLSIASHKQATCVSLKHFRKKHLKEQPIRHCSSQHHKRQQPLRLLKLPEAILPIDYEVKTRLLQEAYQLQDQAFNDRLAAHMGKAIEKLQKATRLSKQYYGTRSPAESLLYLDLARCAAAAGDKELAYQSFQEAIGCDPGLMEAHLGLCKLLAGSFQKSEALQEARAIVRVNPQDPRATLLLNLLLDK